MIAISFYCFPSFLYYVYSNPVLHTNDKSQRNRISIHYTRLSFPFLFSIDPNKYFSFALLLTDPNYHFMHFHISECLYNIILPFCSQIIHHSLPGKVHTSSSFCKKIIGKKHVSRILREINFDDPRLAKYGILRKFEF